MYGAIQIEILKLTKLIQEAFCFLNYDLTFKRVINIVQLNAPLFFKTDANLIVVGAALEQVCAKKGKEYFSWFLSEAFTGLKRR